MANFKLGAIFTDIAGSIGGTTFRRTPRGLIGYNKQGTQIKSAFAPFSVKNKLGVVLAGWSNLDNEIKTFWNNQAKLYQFKNKFNDLVYLTGRQLYTKLNAQLVPVASFVDIENWDDRICPAVVNGVNVELGEEVLEVTFDTDVLDFYILISVYQLRKGSNVKPHTHFRRTYSRYQESVSSVNIYDEFRRQFPFVQNGDKFGMNVNFMSVSGFQTSTQAIEFIAM